jgi:hypothetical protein
MQRSVSRTAIMNASIQGICNAQRDYAAWSGGLWLWEAPEYLSGTYVAQEIAKVAGKQGPWFLTMENSTRKAIKDAGTGNGRMHSKIRPNGRFDLLLWSGKDEPRAPIEIKCQVTNFEIIRADIERLNKVIHRKKSDSSIQFGLSVFYTSTYAKTGPAAKAKIADRVKELVKKTKMIVGPETKVIVKTSVIKVEDISAWQAVAIALKPARNSAQ